MVTRTVGRFGLVARPVDGIERWCPRWDIARIVKRGPSGPGGKR